MRTAIDTLRSRRGLAPYTWTDSPIGHGTILRAAHFIELRAALADVFISVQVETPSYTDPVITPGVTVAKALHLTELQAAILTLWNVTPPPAPTPTPTPTPSPNPSPTRIIALSGNLAFGFVLVGTTREATLSITNSGNAPLTVSGLNITAGLASAYAASWTSGTIPAGATQPVTVWFSPTAAGSYNGTITVTGDQTGGTNTIAVTGSGVIPAPTPTRYYVWGQDPFRSLGTYTQYLGYFSCLFCDEFGSDSINNQFGTYGSRFSSTSIRNEFGRWGSQFSTYSACNEFASTPPRVYNADFSVYYGELTVNRFRSSQIDSSSILNWLIFDVCNH